MFRFARSAALKGLSRRSIVFATAAALAAGGAGVWNAVDGGTAARDASWRAAPTTAVDGGARRAHPASTDASAEPVRTSSVTSPPPAAATGSVDAGGTRASGTSGAVVTGASDVAVTAKDMAVTGPPMPKTTKRSSRSSSPTSQPSSSSPTATATSSAPPATSGGVSPTLVQEFNQSWSGWPTSPDNNWRVAGDWTGTGGNQLLKANAALVPSYAGQSGGYLTLTSRAGRLSGGEIQTMNGAGGKYGYYEVRMMVSSTPGVCDSFFWIGDGYGNGEIDVEFLTNESWISSASSGLVHFTVHAANGDELGYVVQLGFNPSKSFHRYGFLRTASSIVFTVDGRAAWSVPGSIDMVTNIASSGYIMMNSWTGNATWGGGPPLTDSVVAYDWVKYYAGATTIAA